MKHRADILYYVHATLVSAVFAVILAVVAAPLWRLPF